MRLCVLLLPCLWFLALTVHHLPSSRLLLAVYRIPHSTPQSHIPPTQDKWGHYNPIHRGDATKYLWFWCSRGNSDVNACHPQGNANTLFFVHAFFSFSGARILGLETDPCWPFLLTTTILKSTRLESATWWTGEISQTLFMIESWSVCMIMAVLWRVSVKASIGISTPIHPT